ncbi:MAG: beta-lactamase family protein [Kangiellaceae bacterium]|nr:beta-lactamase family protein [Kangiellaceae bacterium]
MNLLKPLLIAVKANVATLALYFAIAASVSAKPALVTEEKIRTIESYLIDGMEQLNVPGLSIGIIENGEIAYLKSLGEVYPGGEDVAHSTPFKLGSVSKTFTSLAVMKLYEDGKIDIDKPVVNYIPWFQTQDKVLSDQITVKQLLNHTSGFSKRTGNRNQDNVNTDSNVLEQAAKELKIHSLASVPGERFQYSNTNYQLLGYLVQSISGQKYTQFVRETIFAPLKMSNSFMQEEKAYLEQAARGHLYWFGQPVGQIDHLGPLTSAQGGIYSSAEDMLVYLKMMLSDDSSIISNETKQKMLMLDSPEEQYGYGLGWYYRQIDDFNINYHFGQSAGFEALISFSKDLNIGWFIVVNSSSAFGDVNLSALISQIGPVLNGKPATLYGTPFSEKILFWLVLLIPIIVILLIWRLKSKANNESNYLDFKTWKKKHYLSRAIIPAVISFIIPYFLLVLLPSAYGAPLNAIRFFQPLIFCLIVLSSISIIVWLLVRVWLVKTFILR